MGIEVIEMCHSRRRHIAFPLFLILAGALILLGRAGVVHVVDLRNIWPVMLIALGLDQLYGWAKSRSRQ